MGILGRQLPFVSSLGVERNVLPLAMKDTHHHHHHTAEPLPHDSRVGFIVNPPDDVLIKAGTVVIVLGDVTEIHRARIEATRAAAVAGAST